jgi:enoyl-CoA hydratase/carnithine racemase
MTERVTVAIDDQIATVTLNRPEKYNGLDLPMFEAIEAAEKRLRKDRSVRAVILRGEGKAFCTGLDIKSVSASPLNFSTGAGPRATESPSAGKPDYRKKSSDAITSVPP